MKNVDERTADAHAAVAEALAKLQEFFKPECRLTFVMRTPGRPETEMVVTDDPNLSEVAATIVRSQARRAHHLGRAE